MGESQDVTSAGSGGLAPYLTRLAHRPAWRWSGRVVNANGQTVEAEGPLCSVGECCEIVDGDGERHRAEVIGFRGRHVLAMPLKATRGIRYGDAVLAMGVTPGIAVGTEMEGRIVDARCEALAKQREDLQRAIHPMGPVGNDLAQFFRGDRHI